MKFKMAPNSLFAILLRSPWWWSLGVFALIALLALALLPAQWQALGVMAGLPFLVICGMAAWRQWQAPSGAQVDAALSKAQAMNWPAFADALQAAWEGGGYTVERTTGGADLRVRKGAHTALVSARRWKASTHGLQPLRELQEAVDAEGAREGVYIAVHGSLSDNAAAFAKTQGIQLLQAQGLAYLLTKGPK